MSSRARLLCDCVGDQLSVHEVGQAAFQAAHGCVVIFAFGSFPQVIGPAGGIVADLGEGHDVQAEIEWRSPARESRWRTTWPEDTSMGAVPV